MFTELLPDFSEDFRSAERNADIRNGNYLDKYKHKIFSTLLWNIKTYLKTDYFSGILHKISMASGTVKA